MGELISDPLEKSLTDRQACHRAGFHQPRSAVFNEWGRGRGAHTGVVEIRDPTAGVELALEADTPSVALGASLSYPEDDTNAAGNSIIFPG